MATTNSPVESAFLVEEKVHIVWFKRDLRVVDHRALNDAAERGPVLPLFVVEPELWRQPDMSARQWSFVAEALQDLRSDLADLGQPLIVRNGSIIDTLSSLNQQFVLAGLWSHEETGNHWAYSRDRAVRSWCRQNGVP
ncbi:MAG: deoxyribodipyrimidine photo-lyase [Pseudomonadota bacterium]